MINVTYKPVSSPPPADPPAPTPVEPGSGYSASLAKHFGVGLDRPFRRVGNDFATVSEEDLVRRKIEQTIGTVASPDGDGELLWRTEFGSVLPLLRHRKNDYVLEEMAKSYIAMAIKRWVPEVQLTSVEVTRTSANNGLSKDTLNVRLNYRIISVAGSMKENIIEQASVVPLS